MSDGRSGRRSCRSGYSCDRTAWEVPLEMGHPGEDPSGTEYSSRTGRAPAPGGGWGIKGAHGQRRPGGAPHPGLRVRWYAHTPPPGNKPRGGGTTRPCPSRWVLRNEEAPGCGACNTNVLDRITPRDFPGKVRQASVRLATASPAALQQLDSVHPYTESAFIPTACPEACSPGCPRRCPGSRIAAPRFQAMKPDHPPFVYEHGHTVRNRAPEIGAADARSDVARPPGVAPSTRRRS